MAVTPEFIDEVRQAMNALGANIEQTESVETVSEVGDDTILPGVKVENQTMTGYIRFKLAVLKAYLDDVKQTIQDQWDAWFGIDSTTEGGVQKTWKTWFIGRQNEWDVLKGDMQSTASATESAAQTADAATARANTAATGAERVNAQVSGLIVTITDRNGVQHAVDVSIGFYTAYPSVAAMNADAANIPLGKLVSIATTDKLSEENARIYQKRSDGAIVYVADLDQKSSEAWADWLENMKPQIEDATQEAVDAAENADAKAALVQQRIDTADADHQRAETDHTRAGEDRTQAAADHQQAQGDHGQALIDHEASAEATSGAERVNARMVGTDLKVTDRNGNTTSTYVKGDQGEGIDYSTMTDAEKDELAAKVIQQVCSENVLGPTYDGEDRCVIYPITSGAIYDRQNRCIKLG